MTDVIVEEVAATKNILQALSGRPGFVKVSESECAKVRAVLQVANVTTADLAKIAAAVQSAGFQSDHQSELLDMIAEKAVSPSSGPAKQIGVRVPVQDYSSMVNFVPESCWERLSEGDYSPFMEHLLRMGLRNPSEPTSQTIGLIILHQSDGLQAALGMASASRLEFCKTMKTALKAKIKLALPSLYISALPDTPQELQQVNLALFNQAFAKEGPAVSPINPVELAQLRHSTRMRLLRGGAATPTSASVLAAPTDLASFGQNMMMQMQQLAQAVAANNARQPLIRLNSRMVGGASSSGSQLGSPNYSQMALSGFAYPGALCEGPSTGLLALPGPSPLSPDMDLEVKAEEVKAEAKAEAKAKLKAKLKAEEAKAEATASPVDSGSRSVDEVTLAILKRVSAEPKKKCKKKPAKAIVPVRKDLPAKSMKVEMPPLNRHPPIHIGTCTVYTDSKKRQWRTIERENRRKDVKFNWKEGVASKDPCP